jgi:hypothetical protein
MTDNEPRTKTPKKRRIKKPKARIITDPDEVKRGKAEMRQTPPDIWWFITRFAPVWLLLLGIVIIEPTLPIRAVGAVLDAVIPERQTTSVYQPEVVYIVEDAPESPNVAELPPPDWELSISPIFTDEVQYWREGIANWSIAYRVQPNLIATIMQIESCGNPEALSSAGAQGLFQVLDLHFQPGEDPFDPETNAKRGLLFYGELLGLTNLDESLAFAAYNAGPSVINRSPSQWPRETQDYQFWASGISEEAESNIAQSPTLNEWLEAGGASLCAQAAEELGLSDE